MKQIVNVAVFDQAEYVGDWPPENAADCLAWFAEKIDSIPKEFIDTAEIKIDSTSGYEGSSDAKISISYSRMETGAEEQHREARKERIVSLQQDRERAEFKRLQAKYGAE
jgi:hypothetical protein